MVSAKEQVAKIVEDQPDDSSYEEIVRELAFARMIQRGLADADARRVISNEELGRRIRRSGAWLPVVAPPCLR